MANNPIGPLLDVVEADPKSGVYESRLAKGSDIRTDIPMYRVWQHGRIIRESPNIQSFWPKDGVAFLLGCSFSFEADLKRLNLIHKSTASVPMYRTNVPNKRGGIFQGTLVVSMRLVEPQNIDAVVEVTSRHQLSHGEPVAIGLDGQRMLGIKDLSRPDFGEVPQLEKGLIPVFWACGVTPQTAIEQAAKEMGDSLTVTHSPGCMFITDVYG